MINRKASFEYTILDNYTSGIILTGPEIKSIRDNNASIDEAYCLFIGSELFIRNMYIKPYEKARENGEPRRDRKLLLTKKELRKIKEKLKDVSLTIVPLSTTFTRGFLKMNIGVAKGKKNYDKRESIKEREVKRELQRFK